MSYKISKELFEAVMFKVDDFEVKGNIIHYVISYKDNYTRETILIDTFFFKCKEWTLDEGYSFEVFNPTKDCCEVAIQYYIKHDGEYYTLHELYSDSEQQAVINACQWILDNKDKQ